MLCSIESLTKHSIACIQKSKYRWRTRLATSVITMIIIIIMFIIINIAGQTF